MGFTGIIVIILAIAKLFCGYSLSWWVVFSPFWIGGGLLLAFMLFCFLLKVFNE